MRSHPALRSVLRQVVLAPSAVHRSGPQWPSFTMTAAQIGGLWHGYQPPTYGSIDHEPIDGATISFLASNGSNGDLSFGGNILSQVEDTDVFINGVEQNGAWSFGSGTTSFIFSSPHPTFVAAGEYLFELRPAA